MCKTGTCANCRKEALRDKSRSTRWQPKITPKGIIRGKGTDVEAINIYALDMVLVMHLVKVKQEEAREVALRSVEGE